MIKRPFRGRRRPRYRTVTDGLLAAAILALFLLVAARLDRVATLTLEGVPIVNDGDTLTLGGERIRLRGIDAPELDQVCAAGGRSYPCGRRAREAVAALIGGEPVSCSGWERDRYGRLLVECETARGANLSRRLVEQGWAVGYGGYADAERGARLEGAGLWAGQFERPRDWRVRHGALADSEHDLLRRVVDWLGRIFHLP